MIKKFISLAFAAVPLHTAWAASPLIALERASVATGGAQANGDSFASVMSADGRYVAFDSEAALEPGAFAADAQTRVLQSGGFPYYVYVRDRSLGTTSLVSIGMNGAVANGQSHVPAISDDGRFVAFASVATNLTPDGSAPGGDVYLRDRTAGTTARISVNYNGADTVGGGYPSRNDNQPNWLSGDGRYVLFSSRARLTANTAADAHVHIFRRDMQLGKTELVDVNSTMTSANGDAEGGSMSLDGRFVLLRSAASDIVTGANQFGADVIVLRDMMLGTTTPLTPIDCIDQTGLTPQYQLSRNARFAIFYSNCQNLVAGQNANDHWFVRDFKTATTSIFHMRDDGAPDLSLGNVSISDSGRYAVADTQDPNVISSGPPMAGLTPGLVYLRDRMTASTFLISARPSTGEPANGFCGFSVQTPGGRIAYMSQATNLVDGDTNNSNDIIVATLNGIFAAGFE